MSAPALRARYATAQETADWDSLLAENPDGGDFLASSTLAETKQLVAWRTRRVVFERDGVRRSIALVLERRVPLLGRLWYIPRGPAGADMTEVAEHMTALRDFARTHERSVFAVTFEPPVAVADPAETEGAAPAELQRIGAIRRPAIQGSASTAIVRLDRDDDELLASFDKKCRNMVRRAQRDGVTVRTLPAEPETFEQMHRLMRLVGGGSAKLALRPRDYTESLWRGFAERGQGRFYAIDVDGTPAVMSYMIVIGKRAFYKDGGSERDRVSPGMSNLIIWQMMLDAREAGATEIDLVGIAPAWAKSTDDHPSYGLGLFKLSFARERTDYVGAFDLVLRPAAYRVWQRIGERVVAKLHRRRYRDIGLY
ncbi:lipid II:glycine glycyltransferase FemX [Leucobacter chironomi]|uniref:lipid II:glycine glycyltransferase FemX n=1 Tax=Leucobacter chironomi TaxID=491918 RepID=UPI00040FF8C8|nr:peptidoglycan bridge formation glycyltransferase FemA/FemB family protein [Leucobacter chironomi]